jgi:hypothetical protein
MSRCDLPVPESPIRHSGWPALTQAQVASWWITAGFTDGLAAKSNSSMRSSRGEAGVVDAAGGAAVVPVVALGHQQLGEEAEVGQLLTLGCGGDLVEPAADGRQPQHAGGGVDGLAR